MTPKNAASEPEPEPTPACGEKHPNFDKEDREGYQITCTMPPLHEGFPHGAPRPPLDAAGSKPTETGPITWSTESWME